MTRFMILSSRDNSNISEHEFAWYWNDGYHYVDARFLYLGKNRDLSKKYIELFSYKLFYMNPEADDVDVFKIVRNIVDNKIENGTPVFLTERDIDDSIKKAYNNIPEIKDWKNIVTSKYAKNMFDKNSEIPLKRVEFKSNISGLLRMTSEEETEYKSLNTDKEKRDYIFKVNRIKKLKYALSLDRKHKFMKKKDEITSAMHILSEDNERYTVYDVSEVSGISVKTVIKYINMLGKDLNKMPQYNLLVNKHEMSKINTFEKLKEFYDDIMDTKGKVSKMALHKESGVSRVTIDKYWNDLK